MDLFINSYRATSHVAAVPRGIPTQKAPLASVIMAISPPKCAVNMEQRLAALRRDQEIDGLRVYLIKYNLFPRNRDPHNSPIRIEELKELVKHWKLHRQRGFWRDHPDKDDLVRALLQHIKNEAMNKKRRQEAQERYRNKTTATEPAKQPDFSGIFGDQAKEQEEKKQSMVATKKRLGGDLFYQRGDYDEGMIYLSRIDKSKFQSENQNPRNELLLQSSVSSPTPLSLLSASLDHPPTKEKEKEKDAAAGLLAQMMNELSSTSVHNTTLSREMKLRCVEGFYNVSCHRGFEHQMIREGALSTILNVLKVDDATVRLYAAATLLNLTALLPTKPLTVAGIKDLYAKMMDEGVIGALLELSHTPHPSVKAFCARALFRFTSEEAHHFRMVHEGAVVVLSQLMATLPQDEIKEACMKALINLASIPRAITCDAILNTLIYLVKTKATSDVLHVCATGLLNLSIMPTTRSTIVEEGAIAALSALAATKQLQLLEMISCVLCNLSAIRTNQEPMVKNSALLILSEILETIQSVLDQIATDETTEEEEQTAVQLIATTVTRIRKNVANTMAHFCCNPRLQVRMVNAGFVPRILRLLTLASPSVDTNASFDEETEKFCVISVANLSLDDRCRAMVVQENAVPLLLKILHDETRTHQTATLLKLDCVIALSNLMLHPKNFQRMVDEGVVPALIALIDHSESHEIQKACVYAMLNLAKDSGMKTKLAQTTDQDKGTIPTMLVFGSKQIKHAELCGVCISFLHHLSTRQENYEILFFEGAVGLLVRVLQKPSNAEVPHILYHLWLECMQTLSNLASYARKRQQLIDDGVIEAIQHFLSVSAADTRRRDKRTDTKLVMTQFAASQILFKLHELCCATKEEIPAFFASLLLLATQSSTKNSRLSKRAVTYQQKSALRCALTIAKAALSARGLRLLSSNVDIPPALNVIMRTGLHEAQVCAAIALCNLATERGHLRSRVWRDSTVEDFIVITLLRLNSDQTKEICAKALFNLLTHEDTRDQMVKDGVLYALMKLARLDNEEIRDLSLRSIYNISLDGTKAKQLLDMEIVRILSKMYQSEFSKEIKRLMCGILSNLSVIAGYELQLLHEGALGILKNLVKVRDPETKVYAANILFNLSCCVDIHELLVRDESNVIATLLTLLKLDQKDVKKYAAMTIANLSGSLIAINAMTSTGSEHDALHANISASVSATLASCTPVVVVLNDVLKRTMASCVQTTSSCVFALRNLFSIVSNQKKFIECNGVQTLAAILSCDAMEQETATLHLSTDMLCALANMDNAKSTGQLEERLVKDGIVRALVAIAKGTSATTGTSERVSAMNVITSLSNLSKYRACHDLMLRDGTLEALAFLCKTNGNDARAPYKGLVAVRGEEFCHHCAVILRNLSIPTDDPENKPENDVKAQRIASQPAAVLILLALANSANVDTREHVVMALHNLALYRRCRMQMLRNDGIKVLLRLSSAPASAIVRHVCSLALQLLSKHDPDDLHVGNIVQEGLVAAIASLAEQHHHDVLVHAAQCLQLIAIPSKTIAAGPSAAVSQSPTKQPTATTTTTSTVNVDDLPQEKKEIALLHTQSSTIAQQGAAADWAKVSIPNMASWKELEDLAIATNNGEDHEEDDDDDEDHDGHDDDGEEDMANELGSLTKVKHKSKHTPATPLHQKRGNPTTMIQPHIAVTTPRVCNVDMVLGTLQLLDDTTMDKVKINIETDLTPLPPRRMTTTNTSSTTASENLPRLSTPTSRPPSAPESPDRASSSVGLQSPPRPSSTLTQARQEAAASPIKSPSSAKRKSRVLEPLNTSVE